MSPVSPFITMPGVWANRVQMLGPAPSAMGEPSIWWAAVAAPHRKPSGNAYPPADVWLMAWLREIGLKGGMKTITWQNSPATAQLHDGCRERGTLHGKPAT